MRLCLNGATIMHSPLASDVEIAAECGFSALEVWAGKLDAYRTGHPLEDLATRLHELRVTPWCINSIENITHRNASGRRELLAEMERVAAVARTIGAPGIVVVPGERPEAATATGSIDDATDVLRAMSDVAGDVALAFEFLSKPRCAVPTLDMAIEIVSGVDRPNVGMVMDTFHFYAGGSDLGDIARIPLDKLFVVHLNGCEDLPKARLTDAHRLYPGEGVIPIGLILQGLRSRGFDGMASVEIFRPEYWQQDPREVAATAHARATSALIEAGYQVDA